MAPGGVSEVQRDGNGPWSRSHGRTRGDELEGLEGSGMTVIGVSRPLGLLSWGVHTSLLSPVFRDLTRICDLFGVTETSWYETSEHNHFRHQDSGGRERVLTSRPWVLPGPTGVRGTSAFGPDVVTSLVSGGPTGDRPGGLLDARPTRVSSDAQTTSGVDGRTET